MRDLTMTTIENDLVMAYTTDNYSKVVIDIENQDDAMPDKPYTVLHLTPQEAATLGVRLIALATFCDDEE